MFNIKTLNSISPVYKNVLAASEFAVGAEIENPDAIIVRSADMHAMTPPAGLLAVGRAGAGYNNIPVADFGKEGIVVFNTPGANANAVKELSIAALLLASRDIVGGIEWAKTLKGKGAEVAKLVEKGKSQFVGPELMGKTIGVVGLGGVGGLVANAAADLKMRVLGYDPFISVENAWKLSRKIVHMTDQDEMLPQCDYLSIHVPLMDATRGSFNEALFAKMKKGAALINLARGELVNNADLLAALASGQLRRYVTDFPADELIGAPGVVAIPHLGASTPESEDNCVDMVSRQLEDYLKFGSIVNSVNYPACPLNASFRYRLAVLHANVPNTVGPITSQVAAQGVNIDNMVNKSRGEFAYTVLDLDEPASKETLDRIAALDFIYRVRYFE
ncbi:MAG: phosphoglycerate dehydrogenase [Clostridia bacterium]|nr:phosphoglycerate dehydrogenase [Clostridia bacterium]